MGIDNFKSLNKVSVKIIVVAIIINIVAISDAWLFYNEGMVLAAIFLTISLIIFNGTLFYLKRTLVYSAWPTINLIFLAVILWIIFLHHKPELHGLLPPVLFPVYAYLLKGLRRGLGVTIVFLTGLLALYLAALAGIFDINFSIEETVGYLVALTTMSVMIYIIHRFGKDERIQSQEAVKNYEALLDHLPVAVLMINKQFNIISANQLARSSFPKTNIRDESICYKSIETGNKDSFCPGCPVEKAFKDGRIHSFEQAIKTTGGGKIYRVVAKAMKNQQGDVYAVTKMMEDITEKKLIESRLHETEELITALGQHTSAAIFLYRSNRFILVNPAFARITGYSIEELYKMNNWEMFHHDHRGVIAETMAGCKSEEELSEEFESKLVTPEGQERWVDFLLTSAVIGGKPTFIGTLFDINERKWAEETLQNEQHFITFLMNHIPHQIYFKDTRSRFVRLNKSMVHRFGLIHTGEAIGKTDFDFFGPEHAQKAFNDEQYIIATGSPIIDIEERETWPDGSITWVSTSKMLFTDHNGQIAGTFGISKDITDLRNAREKLLISEQKYRLIAENALDVIWIYNVTLSRFTYMSSSILHLRGFTPEEACNQSIRQSLTQEYHQPLEQTLLDAVEEFRDKGEAEHTQKIYEFRQPCKDGSYVWVEASMQLQENINGEIEILGVSRNIEKRKKMEQEIQGNNQLQQLVSHCSGDFINATPDNLDSKILGTLQLLGDFFCYDNVSMLQVLEDKEYFDITHRWCTPTLKDSDNVNDNSFMSIRRIAWWQQLLDDSESIVIIPDVDKMPQESATQQSELKSKSVESLVGFPILRNNQINGFLLFISSKKNSTFTPIQISAIKLIVNIICDSIERDKGHKSIINAEQNSRKTATRYQAFIDASNTGAWEHDIKTDKLWCSPRFFSMLGRNLDDYLQGENLNLNTWADLLHPDDKHGAIDYYNDYIKEPIGLYQQVFRLSHINGDYRWILSRGQLLKDENGLPAGVVVGTHIDITEEKRNEEIIIAKNKELESFLSIASHDLRSPLVNIQGFSKRIEKQVNALTQKIENNQINENEKANIDKIIDENIPRSLSFIYSNVKKMDSIINALLNISRTGQMKMTITKIDMKALIDRIVAANDYQIEQSGAIVETGDLPTCYGDVYLLGQLFTNLVDNAIKYRKQGTPLKIFIEGKKSGSKVICQIADNGQGIPTDKISKIWEVFYRADPSSDIPGDGIGLTLALKIAEKHGGKIWAESTPEVGTTFFVQLPAISFQGNS